MIYSSIKSNERETPGKHIKPRAGFELLLLGLGRHCFDRWALERGTLHIKFSTVCHVVSFVNSKYTRCKVYLYLNSTINAEDRIN